MHAKGQGGPQNFAEARPWLDKVASQGFAQAQCTLGTPYSEGFGGQQDYAEARRWFETTIRLRPGLCGRPVQHGRAVRQRPRRPAGQTRREGVVRQGLRQRPSLELPSPA
ncbi:MAG: sel1 repeat family protein, partial [Desulfovibrio sp.]|nr:sel1 repeat family protein [Desulfovibrio sp.]